MPGDRAQMFLAGMENELTPERYVELYLETRAMLRLDEPLILQYFTWIGQLFTGNLGNSSHHRMPVMDVVRAPMGNTIILSILTMIFVFLLTIPMGIISAVKRGKAVDNTILFFTIIGFSIPTFLFTLLLMFIFSVQLGWFPLAGMNSMPAPHRGTWEFIIDRGKHMIMPVMVSVLGAMAGMTRMVRASMIDSLTQDYVRTARSKGLLEKVVIYSHAFRNALIPIITAMTGWFIGIFGGTVVIERLFSYHGMGEIMLSALNNQDVAVAMTMNMFYAFIAFAGLLLMDIAYTVADPRIRFE